jgi:hypothetical protein
MNPSEKELRSELYKMLLQARKRHMQSRAALLEVENLIHTAGFKINKYTGRINKKNNPE